MPSFSPPPPPLALIIRFATSIPDLRLPIPSPTTTNAATLCTLIRPHLPSPLSTCPIRLIYAGALLPSAKPLSTSLRLSLPPPSSTRNNSTLPPPPPQQQQQQHYYIHCSLSPDSHLTPDALAAEVRLGASLTSPSHTTQRDGSSTPAAAAAAGTSDEDDDAESADPQEHTPPPLLAPPQGFDRLLAAGLTPPEIASLRSQFLAIQSHTHTPDTMPTAADMRALEEAWLDAGGPDGGGGMNLGAGAGGGGGEVAGGGDEGGGLEDMQWGNVMGFFWAVGAVVWLVREEGVWSKRRQVGVVTGVLVNLAFCVLRVGS